MEDNKHPAILLGEQMGKIESDRLEYININSIRPNPEQPRKEFDEDSLNELAESIAQYGVLQPIILQPKEDYFIIIAGERRWRACKIANVEEIPAIIKSPHQTKDKAAITLIENVQRKNLSPIEESAYYQFFLNTYNYTQEELAKIIGKSRSYISNLIRLDSLDESIKEKINDKSLSVGHAKILVGQQNAKHLADIIIAKNLNVRQTEKLVQDQNNNANKIFKPSKKEHGIDNVSKNDFYKEDDLHNIETIISKALEIDTKVTINKTKERGKVTLSFDSLVQLDQLLEKITKMQNK